MSDLIKNEHSLLSQMPPAGFLMILLISKIVSITLQHGEQRSAGESYTRMENLEVISLSTSYIFY